MPVPDRAERPARGDRNVAAVTYGANPEKKGLDRVLAAWRGAPPDGEELLVTGVRRGRGGGRPVRRPAVARDFRALLRRARVFVTAPRREDHGIAQLEALATAARS